MSKFRNICHVIGGAFFTLCMTVASNSVWAVNIYLNVNASSNVLSDGTTSLGTYPYGALNQGQVMKTAGNSNAYPITVPIRQYYTFLGYFDTGYTGDQCIDAAGYITSDGSTIAASLTSDRTWYAKWKGFTSGKFTLDKNGGDTSSSPSYVYICYGTNFYTTQSYASTCGSSGKVISLTTKPKKAGYSFSGFYGASTGGTQYVDSSGTFLDAGKTAFTGSNTTGTWYAQWLPLSSLSVYNNDGTGGISDLYYNSTGLYTDNTGTTEFSTPISKPSKTGYTFAGYYYNSTQIIDENGALTSGGGYFVSGLKSGVFSNPFLGAQWTAKKATCSSGEYYRASDATCQTCPVGSYCPSSSVSYTYNGSDQGKTPCDNGYTTSSTGSTSSSSCKKTVTLSKLGGSGSLTAISGAGSISQTSATSDAILTCTQGSNCYLPNADTLTPPKGWEYTGGWASAGGIPPCSATYTANTTPTSTSYYACTKTKVYNLPLITILGATGDPLDKGGTGVLCYKNYATVGSTTASKGVYWHSASEPNSACSSVSISADNKVTADQTIELPKRHGYTFMGYYTKNGWSDDDWGNQAITNLGAINSSWLTDFDTHMIGPESTQQYLFARWSIIEKNCSAGTFLKGTSLSCEPCPAGYYCEGGTYSSEGENVGITGVCNTNTYSTGGASAATCTSCTSGYGTSGTAATNHDQKSDCFKQITLDKNEGSGTISTTKTCYEGNTCDFPDASGLTKDGYIFTSGWGTSSSCTSLVRSFTTPTTSKYYACKVALNKNDGSGTLSFTSSTKCSSSGCTFPDASGLTQDGYAFKGGWGTSASCTATTTTFSSITSSTYYACKTANSITITWTGANDGTGNTKITTTNVLYDGDISTPMAAIVSNAGQTFLGWKFEK